ncbi:hypothetical protein R6Q57_028311 [Mikania cordata]
MVAIVWCLCLGIANKKKGKVVVQHDDQIERGRVVMHRNILEGGKLKMLCTKLTKFSEIYSNCANKRKSGRMSDENVLKWAEKEYQLKSNGQTFNHYHVWMAIKNSSKFRVLCQEDNEVQGSSKKTKNSESNEYSPGVRPHIQITRLTSRMTKKKPSSTPHRNRLDRRVEIQQNGLPLRVVKPSPLTRQQPISLINSKLHNFSKTKTQR